MPHCPTLSNGPTAMICRVPHGGPGGGNGPGGAPGGLGIPAAATAWDLKSQVPTLEETGRNERVEIVETCRKDQRCSPEFFNGDLLSLFFTAPTQPFLVYRDL